MKSSLFKALGLCALAVGLTMAFGAVTAQAEPGSFWLVNKEKISEKLLPTVEAEIEKHAILLTELGGKKIHILCVKVLLVETHLVEPLGDILGKAVFHECHFLELLAGGETKKINACTPTAEGSSGLIVTNKILGLIKLHIVKDKDGKIIVEDPVVEFKPAEAGQPFATIKLGEECSFGENIKVEGVWFIEDCELLFLEDLVKHLVQENKALSKLVINGGAKTATIDGSAWAFLGGAHKGMTWAGHPG